MGRTEGPGAPCGRPVDSQTGCHLCSDGSHQSHTHTGLSLHVNVRVGIRAGRFPSDKQPEEGRRCFRVTCNPLTSWSRSLNGLNRGSVCLKWVTAQDTHTDEMLSPGCQRRMMRFRALKASKSDWHVSAGTQHLDLRRTHFHAFVSGTGYKLGILRTNLIGLFA